VLRVVWGYQKLKALPSSERYETRVI